MTDIFGHWPSFHDAEVHRIRLDRGAGRPFLEADIHVFETMSEVTSEGFYRRANDTMVTLVFDGVDELDLGDFNQQNVLFELTLKDISDHPRGESRWEVEFGSSSGLSATFLCEAISVLRAEPFERP